MPKFFVPNVDSPEQAEEAYAFMRKHNYYGDDKPGRLCRIAFYEKEWDMSFGIFPNLLDTWSLQSSKPRMCVRSIRRHMGLVQRGQFQCRRGKFGRANISKITLPTPGARAGRLSRSKIDGAGNVWGKR